MDAISQKFLDLVLLVIINLRSARGRRDLMRVDMDRQEEVGLVASRHSRSIWQSNEDVRLAGHDHRRTFGSQFLSENLGNREIKVLLRNPGTLSAVVVTSVARIDDDRLTRQLPV